MSLDSQGQIGYSYYDSLGLLPDRGFGGADVADSGVSDSIDTGFYLKGPVAAGANEALQWFKNGIENNDPEVCTFLFLIGAPGNGKSHIASEAQRGLDEVGNRSLLKHHRKHEFENKDGQKIVIVNDATIPAVGTDGGVLVNSLVLDLTNAINKREFILVNVNRGILFEELQASAEPSISRLIIQWLSATETPVPIFGWEIKLQDSKEERSDDAVVSVAFINADENREIHVVAVRVDSYSMLEAAPQISFRNNKENSFPLMDTSYKIKRFSQRSVEYSESTAVGVLLSKFFDLEHFLDPNNQQKELIDPFAANLENFRNDKFRRGFQNILRAAELVSSQKLTYREVWGAISAAMVGVHTDPVGWLLQNQPSSEPGRQRLKDLMRLASCRAHQGIFGAAQVEIGIDCTRVKTPITFLTSKIDPAVDAVPGEVGPDSLGWASFVLEAFQAQAEGESILYAMEELMQDHNDSATLVITAFDRELDKSITDSLNGENQWLTDIEKQFLVAWYGEYLLRLYALSHGVSAFAAEVQKLTDAWVDARREGSLEMDTERSIRTLLLPYYSQDSDTKPVLLPMFNGRTEPVVNRTETPKLVMRARHQLDLKVDTFGDSISLELHSAQEIVGKMALDFALLREALTCVDNHSGQTEMAESLTPRIERFRSSMLHNRASNGYYMVYGPKISRITRD